MNFEAHRVSLNEIESLRSVFLRENNFQVRFNACHENNWSDSYLLTANGLTIGYGSVKGRDDLDKRDSIFEFYMVPDMRDRAAQVFPALINSSSARYIECQTNEPMLTAMLFMFGCDINAESILFGEGMPTDFQLRDVTFRRRADDDIIFEHESEPPGDYVVVAGDRVVATGGLMLHYNQPFADIYMEVMQSGRRGGIGAFIVQELKRECTKRGLVPAARCRVDNDASRATLMRAGMKPVGFVLAGGVRGKGES